MSNDYVTNPVTGGGIIDQGSSIAALAASQLGSNAALAGYLQPGQIGSGESSFLPTLSRQQAEETSLYNRAALREQARGTDLNAQLQLGSLQEAQRSNTNAGALDLAGLGENQRTNTFSAELGSSQLAEAQRQADASYAFDVERYGLDVANANYQQRIGEAQMQMQVLGLLTSLRGPSNAFGYNYALNNLGGGIPTEQSNVDPFAAFRGLAQEHSYDPAALAAAMRSAGAPPQIAAAGTLPTLQGATDAPTLGIGGYTGLGDSPFAGSAPILAPPVSPGGTTPLPGGTAGPAAPPAVDPTGGDIPGTGLRTNQIGNVSPQAVEAQPIGGLLTDASTGATFTNRGGVNGTLSGDVDIDVVPQFVKDALGITPAEEQELAAAIAADPNAAISPSTGTTMTAAQIFTYQAAVQHAGQESANAWLEKNGLVAPSAARGGSFQGDQRRQLGEVGNAGGAVRGRDRAAQVGAPGRDGVTEVVTGDHVSGRPTGVEELVQARQNPAGGAPIVDVTPLGARGPSPQATNLGRPSPRPAPQPVPDRGYQDPRRLPSPFPGFEDQLVRQLDPRLYGGIPRAAHGGSFDDGGQTIDPALGRTIGPAPQDPVSYRTGPAPAPDQSFLDPNNRFPGLSRELTNYTNEGLAESLLPQQQPTLSSGEPVPTSGYQPPFQYTTQQQAPAPAPTYSDPVPQYAAPAPPPPGTYTGAPTGPGPIAGLGAADNPLSFQTFSQEQIGQLPAIQKLLGNLDRGAFAQTGLNTTLPGTNVQLGDQFNLNRYGNLLGSEQQLLRGAYESPRELGGLGLDFADIFERSRRAAPLGADIRRLTAYGS